MVNKFIGHVNLHWLPTTPWEDYVKEWKKNMDFIDLVVVLEHGTENGHAHFHYYAETNKTKPTFITNLKKTFLKFKTEGVVPPAQWHSVKIGKEDKLPAYFTYIAKGHTEDDKPIVIHEEVPRLWEPLHEAYWKKNKEINDKKKSMETFLDTLADRARSKGLTTKEDIQELVAEFYAKECKKSFDLFACIRVTWAVWARVNSADCQSELLSQMRQRMSG